MDAQQIRGKEKVHSGGSTSEDSETMPGDVPELQNPHAYWDVRDQKGWEHGIMVDENRQHWKCKYCGLTGRSGGVTGLKRHLVGDRRAKCTEVPDHVCAAIKHLVDNRQKKRQERAALKLSSILRESAQGSMGLAHVPGGTCYCYFCTVEGATEGPEHGKMKLRILQTKMVQVVDMMLSAAEELSAEEQSPAMTK